MSLVDDRELEENLPRLAVAAANLAISTCRECASYHGLWPAFRLSGSIGGVAVDRPILIPVIRGFAPNSGEERWLIAGAADSGVLATVAMALGQKRRSVETTIVERCGTPLALCREYAEQAGMKIRTVIADLLSFKPDHSYHLIFGHSIIGHIAPDRRLEAVRSFRRWLVPGGRLVYGSSLPGAGEASMDQGALDHRFGIVVESARRAGVVDPTVLARFEAWLPEWHARRRARLVRHESPKEIEAIFGQAGFEKIKITTHESPLRGARRAPRQRLVLTATTPG